MLLRKRVRRRHVREVERQIFGEDDEVSADPWFNPYRVPVTDRARAVIQEIAGMLQVLERYHNMRQRKRRASDQQRFEAIVAAVVSDLIHHHLSGSPGAGLVVSRSKKVLAKRSRYRPQLLTETFVVVLDLLEAPEMDFVIQDIASGTLQERRRTTIKASPRLIGRIEEHGLSFEDFFDRADLIEYKDTSTTRRYRDEVQAINAWLKSADVTFDKTAAKRGVVEPALIYNIDHVDPNARQLRRYFSRGSFRSGGRLFGAFWQNLERQSRLRGLRIDGERVISLDYSQFNPLLAYSIAGNTPPVGDAYTITGLERHRERVKRVFNAMMFAVAPFKKFPKGLRTPRRLGEPPSNNEPFPDWMKIEDVTGAIIKKHPAISKLFYSGAGHEMMFVESEIMMQVLLGTIDQNVVALPVFDAIVVREAEEAKAQSVMQEQFQKRTGLAVTIKREQAI